MGSVNLVTDGQRISLYVLLLWQNEFGVLNFNREVSSYFLNFTILLNGPLQNVKSRFLCMLKYTLESVLRKISISLSADTNLTVCFSTKKVFLQRDGLDVIV
jgi:hypothetical protein